MYDIKEQGTSVVSVSAVHTVAAALQAYRYRFGSEVELHAGMAQALAAHGIAYRREVVAGARDRFDFLVGDGLVVEAKIKGSFAHALEQCLRYAERGDVTAIILAATRFWAAGAAPQHLAGKPLLVIKLSGAAF